MLASATAESGPRIHQFGPLAPMKSDSVSDRYDNRRNCQRKANSGRPSNRFLQTAFGSPTSNDGFLFLGWRAAIRPSRSIIEPARRLAEPNGRVARS